MRLEEAHLAPHSVCNAPFVVILQGYEEFLGPRNHADVAHPGKRGHKPLHLCN